MATERLRGVFVPNMVPLDDQGRINEGELRRLTEFLIESGVHGMYPNGSSGEFLRFSFEERKEIVRIIADQNRGRVKILAGAAETTVDTTIEACEYYASLGCDAVAIVAPWYFQMSQDGVAEHFLAVARRSPINITLYNIPAFANEIAIPTVKRLAEHPRIVGIKDSSRDFPRFLNLIDQVRPLRPDFSFLIGWEEMLVPAVLMGGDGATVTSAGVIPEVIMEMYRLAVAGDLRAAVPMQYRILSLFQAMLTGAPYPVAFGPPVEARGFRMGASRQPLPPADQVRVAALREDLSRRLTELGIALPGER